MAAVYIIHRAKLRHLTAGVAAAFGWLSLPLCVQLGRAKRSSSVDSLRLILVLILMLCGCSFEGKGSSVLASSVRATLTESVLNSNDPMSRLRYQGVLGSSFFRI
jgi:hypothetical protein